MYKAIFSKTAVRLLGTLAIFFSLASFAGVRAQDGFVDPDIFGSVNQIVLLADGKIVVAGGFTAVAGQTRSRVARLNPNGSFDASFPDVAVGPESSNTNVYALARQADGKFLIGGAFASVGGQTRNNLARLNADGSLDTSFTSDVSSTVTVIEVQADGKIIIGGWFTTVGGQTRQHVARLNSNGSLDASFVDPVLTSSVPFGFGMTALAIQPDGKILIGGTFNSVAGQARNSGARLNSDGTLDTSFGLVASPGNVTQFRVLADGKIMICGFLGNAVNGVQRRGIARLNNDGSLDPTFGDTAIPSGTVTSFDIQPDGKLIVAGSFSTISGGERRDIARLNSDATFDATFQDPNDNFGGTFSDNIFDLVIQPDGKVLVGGSFSMIGHVTRKNLVRLLTNGTVDLPGQALTVTKTADTNDGVCDSDCSLREAFAVANGSSNVVAIGFDAAVFGTQQTIALTQGELVFENTRRISINGPGAALLTISGNSASRIFRVRRDVIATISGVTMSNGVGQPEGGAIYIEPNGVITSLSINNSVISNNQSNSGGGISTTGSSILSISNSTISGNIALANPGVGGVRFDTGTLTITNCTVSGNQSNAANASVGGISAGNSVFTLTDSLITGNSGTFGGGVGGGSPATITNTTITNNQSTNWAGGLYVGGTTTVNNSTITGNTVTDATGDGGGIYNQGRVTVNNSQITNNSAAFGAGIFTSGGLTMTGTSVLNNTSSNTGGGIYNNIGGSSGLPVSLTSCVISGNTASSFAGGIQNRAAMAIDQSTISNNMASLGGGGVFNVFQAVEQPVLTVTRSTISGNRSNSGGGAFQNQAGTINLTNSTVSSNTAGGAGGAFVISSSGVLNLSFATVAYNNAAVTGGVRITSGTVNANNTIIARNNSQQPGPDLSGQLASQGYNLIGDMTGATVTGDTTGNQLNANPRLDPVLRNNGGSTLTHALQPNSPAIDGGKSPVEIVVDQRGSTRPIDSVVPNAPGGNGADIGSFELQSSDATHVVSPFDFDGDGKTDISIFRPSVAQWWINRSSNGSTFAATFGATTDKIVPGDFTGDGKTDIAIWRPASGEWFVLRSDDFSFFSFPFGTNGDIPTPADFDGDGKTDAAVYRPSNFTWYVRRSVGGTTIQQFGADGDVPVPSDYDGDGKADIAIFRPSAGQWWMNRSSAGVLAVTFGNATDKLVPGDYTGDGKSDNALFRPSTGEWFILRSDDFSYFSFPFGTTGDVPSPGDYDGDGKLDATVFRPSNSTWYARQSTAGTLIQQFGSNGDRPVPNAFVP